MKSNTPANATPLINREKFFDDPRYSGAQISPDGAFISFHKTYKGEMNVWVKKTGEPFEKARPLTADSSRPVPVHFWTRDSKEILFQQDQAGNENYHVYAVNPQHEANDETGVPPARDLTPYENITAAVISLPKTTPGEIIVMMNDRNPQLFDPYRLNIKTARRQLIVKNDQNIAGWKADLAGNLRLAIKQTKNGGTAILNVTKKGLGEVVYSCNFEENCSPLRFHKDGKRVYMVTNKGDNIDLTQLILFNPETKETEVIETDPEGEVDLEGAEFSEATDELLATFYRGDRLRYYPKNDAFDEDLGYLHEALSDGEISFGASTSDNSQQIIRLSSDTDPGSVYLFNRDGQNLELLFHSRPKLPSEHLANMLPIRYQTRDDRSIPGYLSLPKGVGKENLAVVVHPHGGPWHRDRWGYNPFVQFLANRGYAVFQPNFRSSTGYGKDFLHAGDKEWGTGAMQHDITDGLNYLIDEGIADPERISIFGASYGGYATLAGVTFTPEIYAAAISYCGPSNLLTLAESFPAYWKPILEGTWYKRVGNPDIPEDRADLKARSPLFSADQIKTPLMVVQGANDPRVTKHESDQIVVALRERNYPVEYLVADDEGHGFRGRTNRLAVAAAIEKFLAKHLNGRYQTASSDEVEQRLENLTVDPASVTLPEASDEEQSEAARTTPLPKADGSLLQPATFTYRTTVEMQRGDSSIDIKRTINETVFKGRSVWRIKDEGKAETRASADVVMVDHATLRPVRTRAEQGAGSITLNFIGTSVVGNIQAGPQRIEINKQLPAPVLSDGSGLDIFVAGLPLEVGYETILRTFDPQLQKVTPLKLEVTGAENTEVPAGTFETLVVKIKAVKGDQSRTFHVQKEAPHFPVHKVRSLPAQTGGGTATTVLMAI